ncbi:unknown [Mycoplasma sp. CAG:776]|nr:unknown [Mycoplasma sp. CAG:776]
MSKNNMRTPEEKEKILKEFYLGNLGRNEICRKYNISTRTLTD